MRRRTERLRFTSRSGESVRLAVDVVAPRGRPRAAAVFMPGYGSHRRGAKALELGRVFAEAGFLFVAFDPRGHGASSGTLDGLTLERHLEDLGRALDFARALHPRIVGIGSSLGAITLAAHAASHARAFECWVGIGSAFGFFEKWEGVPRAKRPPELTDEAVRSARPLRTPRLARRSRTPALLWHGARDAAIPWEAAARFVALAHGPVELRLLNRGDHRLTRFKREVAAGSLDFVERILARRAK